MRLYTILSTCILCLSLSLPAYSSEEKVRPQFYLGGKFMLGSADLSVGKYTNIANPSGAAKDGKIAQYATQIRWGGGATLGVKIPIIPLIAVRTELEYLHGRAAKTFSHGGETKLGFNTNNLFFNTYVDFISLHTYIKPYISVGIGVGFNELKYTPASIDIGTSTASPINCIAQAGIGTYILLGNIGLDLNIRYLYNGAIKKTYINSGGDATRTFKASPHMVEGLISILIFI